MDDERFEDQPAPDLGAPAAAPTGGGAADDGHPLERVRQRCLPGGKRRWSRRRRVVALTLSLVFAVNAGAAIAAAITGSQFAIPVKLAAQGFGTLIDSSSTKLSAAQAVYSSSTGVKAKTVTKKPLKCTKGKVKRTKKVHGKKVTVCVAKKKRVKAVAKHRLPSFTG